MFLIPPILLPQSLVTAQAYDYHATALSSLEHKQTPDLSTQIVVSNETAKRDERQLE